MAASLIGAATGAGLGALAVALAAASCLVPIYAVILDSRRLGVRDSLFWALFVLVLVLPVIHKFTGVRLYFVLELLLIAAAPLLLSEGIAVLRRSKSMRALGALLGLFLVISLMSSVFGRSQIMPGAYQFATNLKFYFLLLLGFYVAWTRRTETIFWCCVQWLWLPMATALAWQWLEPSTYFSYFGPAHPGPDPLEVFPSRGMATFQHPSFFAAFSGMMAIIAFCRACVERRFVFYTVSLVYFLLTLASTERQEILSIIAICFAVYIVERGRTPTHSLIAAILIAAGLTTTFLLPPVQRNLEREAISWGILGYTAITHPRPVMYLHAKDIANSRVPLGSGLGTFGGAGATRFDDSLHFERGFGRYSWFVEREKYMMDTYWPNILAETGWIGLSLMGAISLFLIFYPLKKALFKQSRTQRQYWLMSFAGSSFAFLLSFTSPAYQDPGLVLLMTLFFGVAHTRPGGNDAS
ncbi:MAG: hypothetical protein M5U08_02350 [Burkholderiales bacterium]|nr:hypothetical protein [Burkholderiales bacterium]